MVDVVINILPYTQTKMVEQIKLNGALRSKCMLKKFFHLVNQLLMLVQKVLQKVKALRDSGVSILIVEQNARAALNIADYGSVLEGGGVVKEGPADELAHDEDVKAIYLGARHH